MGGGGDEPLQATYKTGRPPWVGLWSNREYTGRKEWWGELGHEDEQVQKGKLKILRSRYREEDPNWYDPKVPDGTSLAGAFGLDTTKYPNMAMKGDQIGPMPEFQEKLYKSSEQYKNIAEKYDLSKEHPGFGVSPNLNNLYLERKDRLGRWGLFQNSYFFWGPRFFDKPLNEGAFEKGVACAKYTAAAVLPYVFFEIKAFNTVTPEEFRPRNIFKRYMQVAPLPCAIAFTWGLSLSMAALLRKKDDVHNHLYSSAAVGCTLGAMKGSVPKGLTLGIVSLVLGSFWHYMRISETGLQNMTMHQSTGGIWGGPTAWKLFQQGDVEVPTTKY